jgi:hypothetical protein
MPRVMNADATNVTNADTANAGIANTHHSTAAPLPRSKMRDVFFLSFYTHVQPRGVNVFFCLFVIQTPRPLASVLAGWIPLFLSLFIFDSLFFIVAYNSIITSSTS